MTKSTHCLARKTRNLFAAFCIAIAGNLFFLSHARAEDPAPAVTTIVTAGGDDVSYQIPLTVTVVYDGTTYQNVYATTNSVITFGNPDGTYWDYPVTPSISIQSRDWWALPNQMPDTHFIINVSEGGFQVDGSYRPYGSFTGDVTSIIITAQIQTDGTVAYSYATNGPLSGTERTGARLTDGTIVTLEQAGVIQVEQAPVLEPEPTPPAPAPEPPVVDPTPEPSPEPQPQPEPRPRPVPVYEPPVPPLEPEPEPVSPPEEAPAPPAEEVPAPEVPESAPEPPPTPAPEPEQVPEAPAVVETESESTPFEPPMVTLENGVTISAEQAVAIELLQSPAELLATIFTNPMAALAALAQVGADMSPETRERSEKVVVAAVIVGNIASAAGAAAYRRKP